MRVFKNVANNRTYAITPTTIVYHSSAGARDSDLKATGQASPEDINLVQLNGIAANVNLRRAQSGMTAQTYTF